MDRSIHVKKISTQAKGREIAISDIHGNLINYENLLEKIKYQPHIDRLIIVGDFIEKGPDNLALLRKLMKQSQEEDVHLVMGNCDFTCKNVLYSYRLDFLRYILLMRKNSVLHEMEKEIGFTFHEDIDMSDYCQMIRKHYLKELSFVNDLPHILETPEAIYVHAALQSPNHYGDDFKEVINTSFFLDQNQYYEKKVVVGHMPVSEYSHSIASLNPIYDSKMNVYSIDGGNIVKKEIGQLNAMLIDKGSISFASRRPKCKKLKFYKQHTQRRIFPFLLHGIKEK